MLFLLLLLIFNAQCSFTYRKMKINILVEPGLNKKIERIFVPMNHFKGDIRMRKIATKFKEGLRSKGFVIVEDGENATLELIIDQRTVKKNWIGQEKVGEKVTSYSSKDKSSKTKKFDKGLNKSLASKGKKESLKVNKKVESEYKSVNVSKDYVRLIFRFVREDLTKESVVITEATMEFPKKEFENEPIPYVEKLLEVATFEEDISKDLGWFG